MPLLPEQCLPHGTHRHMLYPLPRQYARDDAVPVGVGLDDRHERRWRASNVFRLCRRFSRWTVMMALLKTWDLQYAQALCW